MNLSPLHFGIPDYSNRPNGRPDGSMALMSGRKKCVGKFSGPGNGVLTRDGELMSSGEVLFVLG